MAKDESFLFKHQCLNCGNTFECWYNAKRKYCSLSCTRAHLNKTLDTKAIWRAKFGEEGAKVREIQRRKKISVATAGENNPMYGRHDHIHGFLCENASRKGKTLEQIHGVERAQEIRRSTSESLKGSRNPMFGKISRGGRSVKGRYKGRFFRSLFEYSFMKHLESRGFDLERDVDYENTMIEFVWQGGIRTYRPDFFVTPENRYYEVKPKYAQSGINLAKLEAAKAQGLLIEFADETTFPKILFDDARKDVDVVWDERTFEYFKKKTT